MIKIKLNNKNMKTKKIKKFISEYFNDKTSLDASEQINLIQNLEANNLINFSFEERSSDCDYWIIAETGTTIKLDCKRFVGVVFDYDVKLYETTEAELIDTIKAYEKTAIKTKNKLKEIKKYQQEKMAN